MERRWADVSFVTDGEMAAGVEGCCHLFGWRTARLIKQQSDRANLMSARRAEETRRGVRGEWCAGMISHHLSAHEPETHTCAATS